MELLGEVLAQGLYLTGGPKDTALVAKIEVSQDKMTVAT